MRLRLGCLFSLMMLVATSSAILSTKHAHNTFGGDSTSPGLEIAMLPTLFPVSHAANLLVLRNGDVLCFWFSGSEEGASDVAILVSRLPRDTKTWEAAVVVDGESGKSYQNPVPIEAADGSVWLLHTSQTAEKGQADAQVLKVISYDEGQHWSKPEALFAEAGSYIRQPIVVGYHGELLLPFYYSTSSGITAGAETNYSSVKISNDLGNSWSECKVPHSEGLVQMDIIKVTSAGYLAFFRSRYADNIYRSDSPDGCHWADPTPTALPNNNASIQAVRLTNGDLVLAFDNAVGTSKKRIPQTGPRFPLSVALSKDIGKHWIAVRDLEVGPEVRRAEANSSN